MIKTTMDKKFGKTWQVVIGEGFGFEITCQNEYLLYVFYGKIGVLTYKCAWSIFVTYGFISLLTNGTYLTLRSFSILKSSSQNELEVDDEILLTLYNTWTLSCAPTGIIITPPTANCFIRFFGNVTAAAPTCIAWKGEASGKPLHPSPCCRSTKPFSSKSLSNLFVFSFEMSSNCVTYSIPQTFESMIFLVPSLICNTSRKRPKQLVK